MTGLVSMKELLQKAGFEVSVRSNTEQSELDVLKRLLGLVLLQTPRKAERDRLLSEWQEELPNDVMVELRDYNVLVSKVFSR